MSRTSPRTLLIAAAAAATCAFVALPASAEEDTATAVTTEAPTTAKPHAERPLNIRAQVFFNLLDTNGDGEIDETEAAALQRAIFATVDKDADGKISQSEFRQVMRGIHGPRLGRFAPHGAQRFHGERPRAPDFHRHGPGERQLRGPTPEQHGSTDQNSAAARGFARIDANGDGVITPEEFAKAGPRKPLMGR